MPVANNLIINSLQLGPERISFLFMLIQRSPKQFEAKSFNDRNPGDKSIRKYQKKDFPCLAW
jgi:hypothetical protein